MLFGFPDWGAQCQKDVGSTWSNHNIQCNPSWKLQQVFFKTLGTGQNDSKMHWEVYSVRVYKIL
jgi:hypothetical protein